ncbi:hypothetical protein ACLOJK_033762 [Asimina triloba]
MPLGLIVGLGRAMRRKRTSSLQILSSKRAPRDYYKGKNCKPTGFHTRKEKRKSDFSDDLGITFTLFRQFFPLTTWLNLLIAGTLSLSVLLHNQPVFVSGNPAGTEGDLNMRGIYQSSLVQLLEDLPVSNDGQKSKLMSRGGYVVVQEKLPNYVVPDLTDFKLKPYVSQCATGATTSVVADPAQ